MTVPRDVIPVLDGRAARARRTRLAVVDALLALVTEGDVRPTAARIAERAGVSLRSVFQHFDDLEALLTAASERQLGRIGEVAQPLPGTGPLEARVRALVDQRARVLEFVTPVRRASLLQEPFSPTLQAARDRLYALGRRQVADVFDPELSGRTAADRRELVAALDATTGWETWEHLRARLGLSVPAAKKVVFRTVIALLSAGLPS